MTLAKAACANQGQRLSDEDVRLIVDGGNRDGRDFISRTYDACFSHLKTCASWTLLGRTLTALRVQKRHLAVAALVLAATRKQPRGVFTVTGLRYDDGRAWLHTPLSEQFVACVDAWNSAVFEGERCLAAQGDECGTDECRSGLPRPSYAPRVTTMTI